LGIAHCIKRQHERGINLLFKAAESADTPEIAQNLVNAISYAPNALRTSPRMRKTVDAAQLLAAKYGIRGPTNGFRLVQLTQKELEQAAGPDAAAMPGMLSSGTGFLINDEGLILTNRHVVEDGKTFMVVLNGGEQRAAEVVVIDEQQDLALVRIKPEDGEKLPYVQLSPNDRPGDGAECTVMGYPLIDRLGASIKITRGIVSSSSEFDVADVLIDAKVNPGNSGGPILDQHGNVMAIVCMKTLSNSMEDTYGIGISAGRIRTFLAKNNVKVTPGNPSPSPLNAEQIATRVKPATVCIIATR
jgi:serine protease Do